MLQKEKQIGAILVQVQDDLRELRYSCDNITVSDRATTLDIQALDNAITKTERKIRKHTEDYFKALTTQVLVLPSIKEIQKRSEQVPKWKPAQGCFPDVHLQGEDPRLTLLREKTLSMRLLCNRAHPKNRAIMYQKCETLLPDVHKKGTNAAKHHRTITGPAKKMKAFGPRSHRNGDIHREDKRTGMKSTYHKQLKCDTVPSYNSHNKGSTYGLFLTPRTAPPTTTCKSVDRGSVMQNSTVNQKHSQITPVPVPVNIIKYPFTITNGRINPVAADFCHFKLSFSLCWSSVVCALKATEKLLRDFAVPLAKVDGERLVEFAQGWDSPWRKVRPAITLLSVLENWEEVLGLVLSPGQRYKGEGGIEAAAIYIQSCWRGYTARTAYLHQRRRRWAARTIAISWLMHTQMLHVRKALQARRRRQLENYRSRAQDLAANWKHIQSSKRIIIHIPSLGYSQSQRLNMRGFDILQNVQMNRLCDIRDKNVEVIYICPQHLGEDILQYYGSLLQRDGATDKADNRPFVVLTPEAIDYFPDRNMCLSTLLKYSPRTLKRIRNLIQGRQAYIVGGVAHVDDLAVADELGVPILGPEPAVAQLYSTKSGGRRIFTVAEVDVPPGQGGIYTLNQFQMLLAELMTQNLDVQRWLFKMDCEHSGRGTAYCDVRHLSCYNWALREYQRCGPELWNAKWIQESVLLRYSDEIPQWLTRYARPAKTSCYPNWTCFLKTFLRQGGVVEAYPPSDSISCLTVDLLVEPGGKVTMMSCGDQLHGSCQLEAIGSTVPQTCVHPETLHSICTRVGQACLQRCIVGYVSVDLATFLNQDTMEQKIWAIDVDLRYSDQLAMTQMLLMMTGGVLDCGTNCLEVPVQVREKHCEQQVPDKPPVVNRFAVLGGHLFHSNLSMLYHNVFFKMCKAHGIGFNTQMKQGSMFALYDSSERCNMGMILDEYMRRQERIRTVSEDLQGALVTFARNLSVIHREISSSKMQDETNFKVLIKNIKDLLQRTVQRKLRAVKDGPAADCVFASF